MQEQFPAGHITLDPAVRLLFPVVMQDIALSLAMLMVLALPAGAFVLWRRGGSRKQVMLMLVLAVVMAANVAIWVIPTKTGSAPTGQTPR